ncbi:hypothetical protein ABKN59_006130 [Abortiporus biennis]
MANIQHPQYDVVSGEQYQYALTKFRIAHEKVEEQRRQLIEQDKHVAFLRERIARLEGTSEHSPGMRIQQSVDDCSINSAASQLERLINQWASDIVRIPPTSLNSLRHAALTDIYDGYPPEPSPYLYNATEMQVQDMFRHAMSQTISEGIVNCLIVTDSPETNIQLTRIHEHLFTRDPVAAAVWRRQTFSAAVDSCSPTMSQFFLQEHMPTLTELLSSLSPPSSFPSPPSAYLVLEAAYSFSRMLHGSPSSISVESSFYKAFVPELGSVLHPRQVELVQRCQKSERGEIDRVGATVFPGLVKVTKSPGDHGEVDEDGEIEHIQTVVRRAHVVCECAMVLAAANSLQNGFSNYSR